MKLNPATPGEWIARNRIYVSAEIARIVFDWQVETFWKKRKQLHAIGFPLPLSPIGHARWYGGDVLDWIERPKHAPDTGNVLDFSGPLRERARLVAQGRR